MKRVARRVWAGSTDGRGVFGILLSAFAVIWAGLAGFPSTWMTAVAVVGLVAAAIWRRGGERREDEELRREFEWCQTMDLPAALPGRERPEVSRLGPGPGGGPRRRERGE